MKKTFEVNTDPAGLEPHITAEIMVNIGDSSVTLDWTRLSGKPVMRVESYDEGFKALVEMAPLIQWLASRKTTPTLAKVKAQLKKLGYEETGAY